MEPFAQCLVDLLEQYGWEIEQELKDGVRLRSPSDDDSIMVSGKIGMHKDVAKKLDLDAEDVLSRCLK